MKNNSKLFRYFEGKYVNVIMRSVKGSQILGEGTIAEGNVIISGYLLDQDDEMFFLGSPEGDIEEALQQEDVVRIYLGDILEEVFEDVDTNGDIH